jgi:hypothetical protein
MAEHQSSRIPVTPELHGDLNRVKDEADAENFDVLLRDMLLVYEASGLGTI